MIPQAWLVEKLDLDVIETKLRKHAAHAGWIRLKRMALPGDEYWFFRSPAQMIARKVRAAGYALVRDGVPIANFTLMRS